MSEEIGPTVHEPVLLEACMTGLAVKPGGLYIDGTGGGGGHAIAIARACQPGGKVIVFDQDEGAIARIRERFAAGGIGPETAECRHGNFRNVRQMVSEKELRQVNGILVDLGLSSDQLDAGDRGFSFSETGPLDMRMDRSRELVASEIVNAWPEDKLADLFFHLGEEPLGRRIARKIKERRSEKPFETTDDFASFVASIAGAAYRKRSRRHPATRAFQALRIAVNDELGALGDLLRDASGVLKPGGRLAVISFHSLEDRMVKQAFRQAPWRAITKRPTVADEAEIARNPRSRSAKLRVGETLNQETV